MGGHRRGGVGERQRVGDVAAWERHPAALFVADTDRAIGADLIDDPAVARIVPADRALFGEDLMRGKVGAEQRDDGRATPSMPGEKRRQLPEAH